MAAMTRENARVIGVLLAVTLLSVAIGAYVGGYFLLSEAVDVVIVGERRSRSFAAEWQVRVYGPAAKVESLLCGMDVRLSAPQEPATNTATPSTANTY